MNTNQFSGKYEIQNEIARGGMGVIYKGLDSVLGRLVAIKILHSQFGGDSAFTKRFLREARSMARLDSHKNIIRVIEFGENADSSQYIVMEYFPGKDLKRKIVDQGKLSVEQVVSIGIQIAEALAYAHSLEIIHRDIKPGNIMIDDRLQVKITDFGIASASDEMSVTSTGQIIGTPEYMSPEQARGEQTDGRSDLYSLGMVMYEMLIGRTPFEGISRMAIVGKLLYEKEELNLQFSNEVPPRLQKILTKLVRRDAQDRIQTANELVKELNEIKEAISKSPQTKPAADPDLDEATILLPQTPRKKASPDKQPVISPKTPVRKQTVGQPAESPKPVTSSRKGIPTWLITGGATTVVLMGVAGYLYFGNPTPTPIPPSAVVESRPALSLSQNEVREIQGKIREIQDRLLQSRSLAEGADAKRFAPENYQMALDAESKGSAALREGGDLINLGQYENAKSRLEAARDSLNLADEKYNRAREISIAAAREEENKRIAKSNETKKIELKKMIQLKKKKPEMIVKKEPINKRPQPEPLPKEKILVGEQVPPENHPAAPVVSPPPAPQALLSPPEPKIDKPIISDNEVIQQMLEKFKSAYERKDLPALQRMSAISDDRVRFVRGIFSNYSNIQIQFTSFSLTNDTASINMVISRLSTLTGENVVPGSEWNQAKLVIRKEKGTWGKINW